MRTGHALSLLDFDFGIGKVRDLAQAAAEAAQLWFEDGFDRAPALVIGLAPLVLVPLVGMVAASVTILRRKRRLARTPASAPMRTEIAVARGLALPRAGRISVEGDGRPAYPLSRDLLSIGREDDNDLQLSDGSVHRHHAALVRNGAAEFLIKDLSGRGGNGVKVNGRPVDAALLQHGDRIEIGAVALKFEAIPA